MAEEGELSGFYVMANGQIEAADFKGDDSLSCSFHFTRGEDWREVHGVGKGESQIAQLSSSAGAEVVWNMPFDVTWTSTNVFGWPRMVLEVKQLDMLGREVVVGYGSLLVPTLPGRYVRYVRTFSPVSGSVVQGFLAWLTANRPEFVRPDFVTENKGREVTRVQSTGVIRVQINVLTRGMAAHGFSTGGPPDSGLAPGQASTSGQAPASAPGAAFASVASVAKALSQKSGASVRDSRPSRSPDEVLRSFERLRASGALDGPGSSSRDAPARPSRSTSRSSAAAPEEAAPSRSRSSGRTAPPRSSSGSRSGGGNRFASIARQVTRPRGSGTPQASPALTTASPAAGGGAASEDDGY